MDQQPETGYSIRFASAVKKRGDKQQACSKFTKRLPKPINRAIARFNGNSAICGSSLVGDRQLTVKNAMKPPG